MRTRQRLMISAVGALALTAILSQAAGIAVAITAAALGARYWALVAMAATSAATNAVVVWVVCSWRPGLPRRRMGVRPLLAFGVNLSLSNVLAFVPRNVDKLLLGAVWGAGPLGLYSKAFQLMLLPIQN